ncbi:hypothetical protein KJ693_11190, partial [bacterium]|nr:hypothetical protein [bacterium]
GAIMSWEIHKLVYQAKSPIHIGYHKLGFIQRTRYYITGKAIWGAMTANITRAFYEKADVGNYKYVGEKFQNDIIPSYFYPAIDKENPLIPKFTSQGLQYGSCSFYPTYPAEGFERLFISSFGQTAIEPANLTAEDETLHEIEYIAPVIEEKEEQQQVYFVGYIVINEAGRSWKEWKDIKEAISKIFVGGERHYGFGRLSLVDKFSCQVNDFFGYVVDKNTGLFSIPKDKPIPGHLSVNENVSLKGDIEPLVGREWEPGKDGKIGFGQKVSEAEICWVPGSALTKEETLKLVGYGRLSKCKLNS